MNARLAKHIGNRLREIRESQGYNIERLAWENDLPKGYLSMIEAGKRLPSLDYLLRLAIILGVNLVDFFPPNFPPPKGQ